MIKKTDILLYKDKEKRSIICLHFLSYYDAMRAAEKLLARPDVIAVVHQSWNQAGIIESQRTIKKTLYIIHPKGRPGSARYETYSKEKAEYIAKYIDGEIKVIKDNFYEMLMQKRNEEKEALNRRDDNAKN